MLGQNEQYNPFNYSITELIDPVTGKVRSDAKLRYSEDWMDEALKSNPLRQEYVASFSGGSDKTKYMFSLGYLDEEGLLKTTKFNRYNGRLNIDSEVTNWLKAGMSANYSRNESNTAVENSSGSSNVWYSAQLMAPIFLSLRKMPMVLRFMTIWEMPFLTMVKTDRPVPVQSGTQLLPYMMICILLKAIT